MTLTYQDLTVRMKSLRRVQPVAQLTHVFSEASFMRERPDTVGGIHMDIRGILRAKISISAGIHWSVGTEMPERGRI